MSGRFNLSQDTFECSQNKVHSKICIANPVDILFR